MADAALSLQQHLQQMVDPQNLDAQLQTLELLTGLIRQKRRNQQKASYKRMRYENDPVFRQKEKERSNCCVAVRYSTDAEWRAKVREKQKQYYHAKKHAL